MSKLILAHRPHAAHSDLKQVPPESPFNELEYWPEPTAFWRSWSSLSKRDPLSHFLKDFPKSGVV